MNWAMERQKMGIQNQKFTTKNLKDWLDECWYLIRFPTMTINQFTACMTTCKIYFDNDEVANIMGYIVDKKPLKDDVYNKEPRK